jgi:N-acetylgalactosamine-N,N'-diacetylbacillosaminyl-diphospho-undecaprenol 4-alpha-N-acetylgalactosaminyltransferase
MAERKRALFLINSLTGGGAERAMCTLLRHSSSERDEFDITLGLLDVEPAAYSPPDWVNVRQLDCRMSLPRSLVAVRRLCAELKPDVTLSFLTRANVANVLGAGAPCVISERANTSAHLGAYLGGGVRSVAARALVRAVYPKAAGVIAVSEGVAQDLRDNFGVAPNRVTAISNPIDAELIQVKAAEPPAVEIAHPYVLAVGRLIKSKNFHMLIRAFAASGISQQLVILGEGSERQALHAVAQECGVADRVLLPGFVDNPYPLMRGADVFVLSSNAEGFPNALVEAMTLGAPVIATNCASGPSEILAEAGRETINGLTWAQHGALAPPNELAPMAEAIRTMAAPERRAHYGQRAAARAKAFGVEVATRRYWDVLRGALRAGPRPASWAQPKREW